VVRSVSDRCRSQSSSARTIADLVVCPTSELVEHRHPDRIDLEPLAPASGVPGGCSLHHQALDSHRGGEDVVPLLCFGQVVGDGRNLERWCVQVFASCSSRLRRVVQRWVRRSMPPIVSRSTTDAGRAPQAVERPAINGTTKFKSLQFEGIAGDQLLVCVTVTTLVLLLRPLSTFLPLTTSTTMRPSGPLVLWRFTV
jgi:hypothetical protein